jgi:rod shape-determining protein MreD
MLSPQLNLYFIVALSFLVALVLSVYPLPMDMRWWRPEFVLVVAIYWIFFMPLTVSFTLLCALGLFQDLLEGVPFGQHSLGLVIFVSCLTSECAIFRSGANRAGSLCWLGSPS